MPLGMSIFAFGRKSFVGVRWTAMIAGEGATTIAGSAMTTTGAAGVDGTGAVAPEMSKRQKENAVIPFPSIQL